LIENHIFNPMLSIEMNILITQFSIGQVVKHRKFPFRGVIIDVDHEFNNTEEWWLSIPEDIRPRKDQPYYHLLAESESTVYAAYVSQQNLLIDDSGQPIRHPEVGNIFGEFLGDSYAIRAGSRH
jgi:heat shock protein HspQ